MNGYNSNNQFIILFALLSTLVFSCQVQYNGERFSSDNLSTKVFDPVTCLVNINCSDRMSGKAPPPSRGRGRGRGYRGVNPYPAPSSGASSSLPSPPADTSVVSLCLEDIPPSVSKKDIIIALGLSSADTVANINLRPHRQQALIEFKNRRGAEAAYQQSLGWLTISSQKYVLSWSSPENQVIIHLPPPPPNALPELDSFGRTPSRGLGRGTYDPQFRQCGHFFDTSQLIGKPGEKIHGKIKRV